MTVHERSTTRFDESIRPDVPSKISGEFEYSNDVRVPGMLFGATKRCPHAHARLSKIDSSKALAMPGVRRVFTHEDVPDGRLLGHITHDQPVFVVDVARHQGEPVAFVVADTQELAWQALEAIDVSWQTLEPVTTIEEALTSDPIHPQGTLIRELIVERGDETESDVVISGTWETGRQDQLFLAPESAVAYPNADGGVTLILATQDLHTDQQQLCSVLDLPPEKVHLINSGIGGAFGGREDITLQAHLAIAALALNKPVKTTYRRSESFLAHPKRHPAFMKYRLGAKRDGTFVSLEVSIDLDGGPYASTSGPVLGSACYFAAGPYRIPRVRVHGRAVRTNNPVSGAMRGFGAVQACFGIESTIDLLASKLAIDPVELRRKNVLVEGDPFPTSGQRFVDQTDLRELIDRCMALELPISSSTHDLDLPGGTGRTLMGSSVSHGEGFALGVKNHLYGEGVPETSWAKLTREGSTIIVESSASECGQGIQGVLDRIVRSEFPECEVRFAVPSTWMQYSGSSSASRQSWMSGSAVLGAARKLKSMSPESGQPVSAEFEYRAPATHRGDPTTGTGNIHVSYMFVAHRASVEVDTELGLIHVAAIATAQDVGAVINPTEVRGQILGGIAQGVGFAINEHLDTPNGLATNNSLTDYLVPTAADMPRVVIDVLEQPDPRNPLGIKGVGEPSAVSSTAAIANAIRRATGKPIVRVPVRPGDIALTD